MTTENPARHRVRRERSAHILGGWWHRLRLRPSSVYSATVLILVVGIAVLFRGFV